MFKVSQDIYLNSSDSANHSKVYGKFKSVEEDGSTETSTVKVFVSPELSEIKKIQVLHFPTQTTVKLNSIVDFIVKKNNTRGNIEVKLKYSATGAHTEVPLQILDPDRYNVQFKVTTPGQVDVVVKFNGVEIPQSPLKLKVEADNFAETLPKFDANSHLIKAIGLGLQTISLCGKNEFTIDASKAGNNILFVGVCGPNGQCDEVAIKHTGKNIYRVKYRVKDSGHYVVIAKWGDDHIPGSPFHLSAD